MPILATLALLATPMLPQTMRGGEMRGGEMRGGMSRGQGTMAMTRTANASVVVNGEQLAGGAIVTNGRVMVEMRPVFEKLGARVDYVASEMKVNAFTPQRGISLTVGSRMAMMPDSVMLDSAPVMRDGKVFVPLRAVSQAFGAKVNWNRSTRTARVTTNPAMMRNGTGTTIEGGTLGSGDGDSPDTSGGNNGGMMGGGRKTGGN